MSTPSQLARWREDTPGCQSSEGRLHFNNAGSALPPRCVTETVLGYLEHESLLGGYEAEDEAAGRIAAVYGRLAELLGTQAGNVAIVENATVAFSQALSAFDFRPGDKIVTTRSDYPSNQTMYLSLARRLGVEVVHAADLPEGGVDPQSVRELLRDPRCRLMALSWVPTDSGLIQPAEEVGAVCEEAGVPYLVDACQSAGQLAIDVGRLRCDFLAGTGRKFLRGPRGIGFLYVSPRALERGATPLYPDMRGAHWTGRDEMRLEPGAERFENWEYSYALVLGLGEAVRYTLEAGEAGFARALALAATIRERLAELPGYRLRDPGRNLAALVTVEPLGRSAEELKLALRERRINTSVSNRKEQLFDPAAPGATSVLRISPHYYNSEAEIDTLIAALAELSA